MKKSPPPSCCHPSQTGNTYEIPLTLVGVIVDFSQPVSSPHHDLVQLWVPQAADNTLKRKRHGNHLNGAQIKGKENSAGTWMASLLNWMSPWWWLVAFRAFSSKPLSSVLSHIISVTLYKNIKLDTVTRHYWHYYSIKQGGKKRASPNNNHLYKIKHLTKLLGTLHSQSTLIKQDPRSN